MYHSRISGLGYYLPKKVLTNQDLEKMVDTSDEWIKQRTGIESRHIAGENELPSDMALKSSLQALKKSNLTPEDLDFILVSTVYPDQLMPNTACTLQKKLGISHIPALDISAACSGFVYALSIANQYIQTGTYKNILIVGTETLHHITNYQDRTTCVLFGDGAGTAVVSQNKDPEKGCIYHQELKAYGEMDSALFIPAPGAKYASKTQSIPNQYRKNNTLQNLSLTLEKNNEMTKKPDPRESKKQPNCDTSEKQDTYIHMEGQTVFKKAVKIMCSALEKTLKDTGGSLDQIDWLVPHQANERILKQFCKLTGFPEEKVIFDIKDTGNISSASIPLSMARAIEQGKIKRGQDILMIAMGGGMTSGSVFLKY
ncbi:MAG: ketoacyl-ACP synthase III [Bdellovibrionales bacterium]|nr:ketoacyl-ACP synthase III [Bdellovibrionales bacterium]